MQSEQNHFLLIRLDEKVSNVLHTLSEVKSAVITKASQKDLDDYARRTDERIEEIAERTDKRIEEMEKSFQVTRQTVWMIAGGLIVVECILRFVK